MGGREICSKMEFNPPTIRHGRVSRDHLHEIYQSSLKQSNVGRYVNNAPNTLFFVISGFFTSFKYHL